MTREESSPIDKEHHGTPIGWLSLILAFSLPLYRPWLTLAATLILAAWIFGGHLREYSARLKGNRLTLAVMVFLALNLASLVWSSDPWEGLRYVAKYRYLLIIPMVASSVPHRFRIRTAAAFQVGSVISVALSAAVLLGLVRIGNAHPGNPSATMAHLDYTLILAVASLLALARALFGELTTGRRWLWFAVSGITAWGLLFNIGRSGQLGFLAGLMVLLAYWTLGRSARAVAVTVLATVSLLVLIWVASPPILNRMKSARSELHSAIVHDDYQNNLGSRVAALTVAGRMVRENPVLGAGAGGNMPRFRELLDGEFEDLKPAVYWYRHFHNQYAQILTELGFVGLLALGWIFFELLRGPYGSRELRAAAWVLSVVYLVGFLGEPFLHKQIPLVTFALMAGLLSASRLVKTDDGTEELVTTPAAAPHLRAF